MVSRDAARTAVGVLGNIISLIVFMSPLPTFVGIWKKGTVDEYSVAPYLATFINCGLWMLYGLPMVHPHSFLVITINGTGLVIELLYLLLFLWFSDQRKRLRLLLLMLVELILIGGLALLVLTLVHTIKLRTTIVGSVAMLSTIMMYAAPLSVMRLVVSTKSVEYMPICVSLASFANAICWTTYAFIGFDPFIIAPNGLGTLLGLAQLILYATFYKSTKTPIMGRRGKGELGLAGTTLSGESIK